MFAVPVVTVTPEPQWHPMAFVAPTARAMMAFRAERITCTHCGLVRDLSVEQGQDYVLWYKTSIDGKPVWAKNLAALDLMISWLTGKVSSRPDDPAERALVEVLPAWMTQRRDEVVARLTELRAT